MSYHLTFQKAKDLDVNRLAAARVRYRFLDEVVSDCLEDGSDIALFWAVEALEEMCWLIPRSLYEVVPTEASGVTDEMIEQANNHPVENLVKISKGKATAWCHDDKRPSLYKGTKGANAFFCPVCNKGFGPIQILMSRDGYSFVDAVRQLS
jgi:hypothetical protein